MKKTLLVVSAILALSLAFVGCKKSTGDNNEPSGSDPVKADAYVLNVDASYDNYIELIAPVAAASGYTKINAELKWESSDGIQAAIQLMSGDGTAMKQASATVNFDKSYSTVSGACLAGATYTDWSTGSAQTANCVDTATKLQFYIQNASYAPTSGKIYVKKVWLSGAGKDDLVVYEFKAE